MSHQYPTTPVYGAQYPSNSFYPQFSHTGQQGGTGTAAFSQLNGQSPSGQIPTTLSNSSRYDLNAGVHHQPAPLPFAPHFNPDLLKHFPAIPPPPLPLGFTHFPPSVNTPPIPIPHQNYPAFPPPPPTGSSHFAGQTSDALQDQRSYGHSIPGLHDGRYDDQTYNQLAEDQSTVDVRQIALSTDRPLSGVGNTFNPRTERIVSNSNDFNTLKNSNEPPARSDQPSSSVPAVTEFNRIQSSNQLSNNISVTAQMPSTQPELKERAKAALLSLVPYNIRYDNLLAEGVDSHVLQRLYEELGLNWQSHTAQSGEKHAAGASTSPTSFEQNARVSSSIEQNNAATQKSLTDTSGGAAAPKISSAATPVSRASPTVSQNMERKDRIAQLLAAKAGKASAPSIPSKSESPASASELTPSQLPSPPTGSTMQGARPARNLAQAELVKQKMEQLKKETMAKVRAEQAKLSNIPAVSTENAIPTAVAVSQKEIALPTPVREHLVQTGFASLIPGLFMTSAEAEEAEISRSSTGSHVLNAKSVLYDERLQSHPIYPIESEPASHSAHSSRKRPAEDSMWEDAQDLRGKRQATGRSDSIDVPMDMGDEIGAEGGDYASEGEVIEDEQNSFEAQPKGIEVSPDMPRQPELATQDHRRNRTKLDTLSGPIEEVDQQQDIQQNQSYILSPTNSAAFTPTTAQMPSAVLSSPSSKLPDVVSGNTRTEDRPAQSPRSLLKATPEQIAERAAQLKADFLRQRAIRQKQLQEGIPVLNTEVAKTQTRLKDVRGKLAQVRADLQGYETSIRRARETERELAQEIEQLETQISNGVSGQKQYSKELNNLRRETSKNVIAQPQIALDNSEKTALQATSTAEQNADTVPSDHHYKSTDEAHRELKSTSTNQALPYDIHETTSDQPENNHTVEPVPLADADEAQEPELGRPSLEIAQADTSSEQDKPSSTMPFPEEDDGVVTEDSDEAMQESSSESGDSHMSIDEASDDSVSMSDSGSDEYEPAEPEMPHVLEERTESDEYEPEIPAANLSDESAGDDADDYEPAEDMESVGNLDNISTSVNSNQVPRETTTLNTNGGVAPTHDGSTSGESLNENIAEQLPTDDQESGLQLSEAQTLTKPQHMDQPDVADGSDVLGAEEPSSVRFVPYQSPLGALKSYRFHPFFTEQVKDGYRSLTYSHKIDSKLPLCQTESDGLVCTDSQCQDQHFASMALTDDKILVQMSSASDIKDKNLRDQYLIGLKQVIARLRQEGVKEFSAVADALSQYRRDWTAAQTDI